MNAYERQDLWERGLFPATEGEGGRIFEPGSFKELGPTIDGGWLYRMWPGEYVVTYSDRRARVIGDQVRKAAWAEPELPIDWLGFASVFFGSIIAGGIVYCLFKLVGELL